MNNSSPIEALSPPVPGRRPDRGGDPRRRQRRHGRRVDRLGLDRHPGRGGAPGRARTVFSAVPFTSATVTVTVTSGALSVTWSASHLVGGVAVFTGSSSTAQPHFVGFGKSDGALTVTAAYGGWIRLVPTLGEPLLLRVRDLGLASDPNLRDIGGYRTADGRWVGWAWSPLPGARARPGRPCRCGNLGVAAGFDLADRGDRGVS